MLGIKVNKDRFCHESLNSHLFVKILFYCTYKVLRYTFTVLLSST